MKNEFQFLLYNSADEHISVNAIIKDESIWLTQKAMAELFGCSTDNISLHLKNIFSEDELQEEATTEFFSVVQKDKGTVSRQAAKLKAETEYKAFNKTQKITSDFDKSIKKFLQSPKV